MQEVAEEITKGLDLIKDNKFTDAGFEALTKHALSVLLDEVDELAITSSKELSSVDPITLKESYATLITLVLHFAKLNADADQVKEYLTENQVPDARIATVTSEYQARFSVLRQRLSAHSFHFPHIVDVQWRCDFLVKTGHQERLTTPTFFVKLKIIDEKGQLKDIQFTCNHDQLQDLVGNLRDATASLERLDMYQTEQ